MNDKARLFFALEIPLPIKRMLVRLFDDLKLTTELKPATPEFIYLTLKFWPMFPLKDLARLTEQLTLIADQSSPVPLIFTKPEIFGGKTARALVIFTDLSEELDKLHFLLESTLAKANLADPERRQFKPHITIARLHRGLSAADKEKFLKWRINLDTEATRLVLFESRRTPEGRAYDSLLELPL